MYQLLALAEAVRPHQWAKNVLLALPLAAAHQLMDFGAVLQVIAGIALFSLMASSIYLINDSRDIESDRAHPEKKHRPLASGRLSLPVALTAAALGGLTSVGFAATLSLPFALVLLGYAGLSIGYTVILKRIVLVDVFALVALYLLRIFAGAVLVGIAISPWLLAFSLFMFLSLALVKRQAELLEVGEKKDLVSRGRGWAVNDIPLVRTLGVGAGLISVLVLALYVDSEQSVRLYEQPLILWLVCPLLLFWIVRVWRITEQGKMYHDPLVFAMRDVVSAVLGIAIITVIAVAVMGA